VGKWHVNPVHDPRSYGFDEYLESGGYGAFRAARHPQAKVGHDWFGQEDPVPVEDSHTHWLADRAIEMIERFAAPPTDGAGPQGTAEARYAVEARHAAPWHLSLDFAEPHLPCNPCRPFSTQYDPTAIEPWGSFGDTFADKPYIQKQMLLNWGYQDYGWEQWAPMVARYYGVISQMDDAIGKVLDRLEKLGILDDTIVVYTSDHGDMCGSHRMMDKHYVMYDDIVRVPFAIRWPAGIVGGGRSDSFVYPCLDLVPTILDLAGIEAGTDTLQGRSLRPLLEGAAPGDWRDSAVSTYHGQQFGLYVQRMLRERRWKYIWNPTDVDELYDLAGDPNELNNRVHDAGCSGLLADMRMRLLGELTAMGDGIVCRSPWMRRQLETGKKI
jgi:arylsulfatase A-like enzyme